MRILAIDAGNSRIKWGVHEDGSWLAQGWVKTAQAGRIGREWAALAPPDAAFAANVAGPRVARALAVAARRFKRRVRFVKSAAAQCGVKSAYSDPARLGPDRWAALIAARHHHRGPCLVVNAGTTLTADAIESGAVNALAGAIERMLRFMREAGQAEPLTLLSGGAAHLVAPQLNGAVEVVDNLVLEGVVRIALSTKSDP